jgi:hypothetical protein
MKTSGRWTKSINPAILGVIHKRQNPIDSTSKTVNEVYQPHSHSKERCSKWKYYIGNLEHKCVVRCAAFLLRQPNILPFHTLIFLNRDQRQHTGNYGLNTTRTGIPKFLFQDVEPSWNKVLAILTAVYCHHGTAVPQRRQDFARVAKNNAMRKSLPLWRNSTASVRNRCRLWWSTILGFLHTKQLKLNSMDWVRERTIPTEWPPLVGEVSANFCG